MEVAVLGAGNVGQTMAADLSLKGYKVRLFELPEFAKNLGEVLESQKIELRGDQLNFKWFKNEGVAEIDAVTTNMKEALEGVKLVLISIPAMGHKTFFERMIPHLEDGQIISLFPDNYGSLVLRKMLKDSGVKVIVGGWTSAPYGTRIISPGKVDCMVRAYRLRGDSLPSKDWPEFLKANKDLPFLIPTKLEHADTVLAVGLENPNPIVHVPGAILNVGAMEVSQREDVLGVRKGEWSLYKHGMSESVVRVIEAFYNELCSIADTIGIKLLQYSKEQFYHKHTIMHESFLAPFYEASPIMGIKGPLSVKDRYFTEDIPIGCVTAWRIARKFGIVVPTIESLIRLGSAVCGRDFFKEGRTLEDLGISEFGKEDLLNYLKGS
ncbi:MAG: NAD/NADP octopine/nopaline dehydrogenase family protein [Archaeoglobus sp.]|nr:NAD/NADP octopine/nopaline dehydrogenase family protein [Archaeoglobus sp.]